MKRTPLYDAHRQLGARMVEFAGWEMPVQYEGIIAEHRAVRRGAGLFDVSHMGEIEISGAHALAACQRVTTNDVARLRDGEAQYTLLCLPSGGVVDDVIVYRLAADRFLFCVNAGNRDADFAWLREAAAGAAVSDRSNEYAQLALQGPHATAILQPLTAVPLATLPPFAFATGDVTGYEAIVAHTGYTGEDGWELYCAPDAAPPLWAALLAAGQPAGLQAAGLGARDTLRLEAALPLYGHELSRDTTPLEAGLRRFVRFEKGDFIGREALLRQQTAGLPRCLVGLRMVEPGIPRQGHRILSHGEPVGVVTSGTKSPTLGLAIALAYVTPACAEVGTPLAVEIRQRALAAEVVSRPFYRRPRP
jgi:aminomethyltransferase